MPNLRYRDYRRFGHKPFVALVLAIPIEAGLVFCLIFGIILGSLI